MDNVIEEVKKEFGAIIEHFLKEIAGVRAGRATPELVENIHVDAYSSSSELLQLAAITTPDQKTISIQPWDKTTMGAIQTALANANLGMQPIVQENRILLTLPVLTGERRDELKKMLGKKAEEARISIRARRDSSKNIITAAEKEKTISEDEKFALQKKLQDAVDGAMGSIEAEEIKKSAELTTV